MESYKYKNIASFSWNEPQAPNSIVQSSFEKNSSKLIYKSNVQIEYMRQACLKLSECLFSFIAAQ